MRFNHAMVGLTLIVAIMVDCTLLTNTSDAQTNPEIGRNVFYLSSDEIQQLKKDALGGSVGAANHLEQYFMFYKMDKAEAIKWLTIEAENGGHDGCANLVNILKHDPDPDMRIRAGFWQKQLDEKKCPIW